MHRLCALAITFSFLLLAALPVRAQQSAYHEEVFTQARAGARVRTENSPYHQIAWTTSGGPGACLLSLDFSNDGMVWALGQIIEMRDCTRSGSSSVAHAAVRYVRMNLNSLSPTAAIRATYTGFQSNPGPTGSVTSVFGRTGDVVAVTGDYNVAQITGAAGLFSPNFTGHPTAPNPAPGDNSNQIATTSWVTAHCASCGGGGGGGLGGSGTANTLSKFTAATTLGNSLLSDNGTMLTYNGSGGYLLISPTASLPGSTAGSSHNGLFSGPDGWYTSDNNGAWTKIGTGGGGGGAIGPGTVGKIAKFTTTSNVGDSLLSDDGTSLTYGGTGGIVTPKIEAAGGTSATTITPATTDNTGKIATTAFVHAAIAAGATPPPPSFQPIAHSAQTTVCTGSNVSGSDLVSTTPVDIRAGDTVFVLIKTQPNTSSTLQVTDSASNSYTSEINYVWNASGTYGRIALWATSPSGAQPATSITARLLGVTTGVFVSCIYAYKGVHSFGAKDQRPVSQNLAASGNVTIDSLQDANGYLFAGMFVLPINKQPSITLGQPLGGNAYNSISLCEATSAIQGAMARCTGTWTGNDSWLGAGIELRPGVAPVTPSGFPRVVGTPIDTTFSDTVSVLTPVVVCSTTDCPAGVYRLSYYMTVATGCTTGGSLTMHLQFTDSVGAKNSDITPTPFALGANSYFGHIDVLQSTGAAPITYTTANTACSAGTASGHRYMTMERLH